MIAAILEHWFASCTIIATGGFWVILVIMTWQEARCEHKRRKVKYTIGPVVESPTPVKPSSMMVCHHTLNGIPCMNRLPCPHHGGSI